MKKAIMNTVIILFTITGCIGCGQSSKQGDDSTAKEVAEVKEQVQAPASTLAQNANEEELENGERVFTTVDVMPSYPEGEAELLKFIAHNIKYPAESQEKGEKGRVICSFVVASDGSLKNHKVVRGISPLLDQEAIRVLKTMPRWIPGMQDGKPVAVKYTIPITYALK